LLSSIQKVFLSEIPRNGGRFSETEADLSEGGGEADVHRQTLDREHGSDKSRNEVRGMMEGRTSGGKRGEGGTARMERRNESKKKNQKKSKKKLITIMVTTTAAASAVAHL
jgi:hypothetical protein